MAGFLKKLSVSLMVTLLGFFVISCGQPYNSTAHMQVAENTEALEAVVYEIDLPTIDHIGEHNNGYNGSDEVVQVGEGGDISRHTERNGLNRDVYEIEAHNALEYYAESATYDQELRQEQYRIWTVEELGEIIVASSLFWEDWRSVTERFSHHNLGSMGTDITHPQVYMDVLPTSGFESLQDIRNYLLQYYTESWVDAMLSTTFPPFVEYNNVLYIHVIRIDLIRPHWEAATHTLISQEGYIAIVDSVVFVWHYEVSQGSEATFSFTFINGRIDSTLVCPVWLEWLGEM